LERDAAKPEAALFVLLVVIDYGLFVAKVLAVETTFCNCR
jgi:hypothetical protein